MDRSHSFPALNALIFIGLAALAGGRAGADAPPPPRPPAVAPDVAPQPRPGPGAGMRASPGTELSPCGRPDIIAERLPTIDDAGACGVAAPVRVRSIASVVLDPPPVIACPLARKVHDWLETSVKPAFAAQGAPLAGLDIAAAYVCRNVNDAENGGLSEHAFGRALDISRFRRADGTLVSVLDDWDAPLHGDLLRTVHDDACGVFGTALGPESDALHADHLHYDIAERRRSYCPGKRTAQPGN